MFALLKKYTSSNYENAFIINGRSILGLGTAILLAITDCSDEQRRLLFSPKRGSAPKYL
jgi:hypothetical protein